MTDRVSVPTKKLSDTRRLLSAGAWAFGVKFIGLFGGMLVNVLLARLLSTDAMGTYFLVITVAGLGALLVKLGMQQTLVRFVAESVAVGAGGRARQTVVKVAGLMLVSSILACLALYSGVGNWLAYELFDAPPMANVLGVLAALVVMLAFQTVVSESFRGLHQILQASLFDTVLSTLIFALILVVLWFDAGQLYLSDALLMFTYANFLSILLGSALLYGEFKALPRGGNAKTFEILQSSGPILVTNLSFYFISNAGLWIVGTYEPVSEVALYGAVVRLVTLISIPLSIVNMVMQPFIAEQNTLNRRGDLERVLQAAASMAGLPGTMLLFVFAFEGDYIMGMIFGEPYKVGGTLLAIFSLGHIVNVWTGSCGNVLIFTGYQKTLMGITLASSSISFLVALLLVQSRGAVGVALAMSGGLALQNLASWWFVHRRVGIWTHVSLDIPRLLNEIRYVIGRRRQ